MTRPEGISESAWNEASELLYAVEAMPSDGNIATIARAIQAAVEAERARAIKYASAAMVSEGKDAWAKGYRCAAADILEAIKGA